MKTLNIVTCAYRATSEEQDDTVVWFVHAIRNSGGDVELMLRGNAVNYAVRAQEAAPVTLGQLVQANPPRVGADLARFVAQGGKVYALADDVVARGIDGAALIDGVQLVGGTALPALLERYDRVWQW